ncbi:MAG: hypothetical protein P8163_04010 [Candidatus Thiodiazotropha sp.]
MGLQLSYCAEEERLDLMVTEDLDQSLACQIMQACNYVNDQLLTCVIDCTRVQRIHDSGRILLDYLIRILESYCVRLIVLGAVSHHLAPAKLKAV